MIQLACLLTVGIACAHVLVFASRPPWFDEVFTLVAAGLFPDIAWPKILEDVHPPGHIVTVSLVNRLLGEIGLASRWSNAIGLVVLFLAALRLWPVLGTRRACIAISLLAGNAFFLTYSLEVRAYFLLLCFSTLGHAALLRWLVRGQLIDLWLLVISAACAGSLHFFGTAMGACLLLIGALAGPRGTGPTPIVVAGIGMAAVLIPFALWLLVFADFSDKLRGGLWITNDFGFYVNWLRQAPLIALGGLGTVLALRQPTAEALDKHALWLLAPSAMVLCAGVLISFHSPVISDKNLIVCVPAGALAVAVALPQQALCWLDRSLATPLVAMIFSLLAAFHAAEVTQDPRWVARQAYSPSCAGLPVYVQSSWFMHDYAQTLFSPGNPRPMAPIDTLAADPDLLQTLFGDTECRVIGLGWHETGALPPLQQALSSAGLAELRVVGAPTDAPPERGRFAGYVLRWERTLP